MASLCNPLRCMRTRHKQHGCLSLKITQVVVILQRCEAIFEHLKVGFHLGTKAGMPDCMVPENQLLQNLYVDYFHSVGPCMTPDGYQVHTFRNSEYAGTASTYTYTTVCAKLPKICNLLRRPRLPALPLLIINKKHQQLNASTAHMDNAAIGMR